MKQAMVLAVGAVILVGLALLFSGLMDFVVIMGETIPQEDLRTDYLVGGVWAMALGLSTLFWPIPARDRGAVARCWFLKAFVTLVVMLPYERRYPGDAMEYFDIPRLETYEPGLPPLGDGTEAMYLFSYIHHQVFPESFHMLKVTCSMIGLVAIYIIYRAACVFMGRGDIRLLYGFCLWPSMIFWSSILGKDPLVLLGIAIYAHGVVSWRATSNFRHLLSMALGIAIAMVFRSWLFSILIAPLAVFVILRMRHMLNKLVFGLIIAYAFFLSLGVFQARFDVETRQDLLERTDTLSRSWAIGGSGRQLDVEFTDITKVIAFLPVGMFTSLFRPMPLEVPNAPGTLAGIENLLLLALALRAALRGRLSDLREPIVSWGLALLVVWSSVYGFVSFQNLGTAVRFRLQIMPILLGLIYYFRGRQLPVASAPRHLF